MDNGCENRVHLRHFFLHLSFLFQLAHVLHIKSVEQVTDNGHERAKLHTSKPKKQRTCGVSNTSKDHLETEQKITNPAPILELPEVVLDRWKLQPTGSKPI